MKRPLIVLFAAMSLIGCYEQPADEDNPEPKDPPLITGIPNILPFIITDSEVTVYWESSMDRESMDLIIDRDIVEQWWVEVEQCTGLEAEAPYVRIVDNIQELCPSVPEGADGAYCISLEPNVIVLLVKNTFSQPIWDSSEDRRAWKHEMIHHLGEMNNKPEYRDHEPASQWQACEWN